MGEGRKRTDWGGAGGSTVLGPHGRDSSKTCLRWPQMGLSRRDPLEEGAWLRRQQAAVGQFPRSLSSPLASLYIKKSQLDHLQLRGDRSSFEIKYCCI